MRYYQCVHFDLTELVPPDLLGQMGEKCWELFDPRLLLSLDMIREILHVPLFINDWAIGGKLKYRGFRPPHCPEGAALSQHRFGRAADISSPKMGADQIRLRLIEINRVLHHITFIEDKTPTWVHIDCRYSLSRSVTLFKP